MTSQKEDPALTSSTETQHEERISAALEAMSDSEEAITVHEQKLMRTYRYAHSEMAYLSRKFETLSERYRLLCKIGEGSLFLVFMSSIWPGTFGSVFKALDLQQNIYDDQQRCFHSKYVAIKRFFDISSPERILGELAILTVLRFV